MQENSEVLKGVVKRITYKNVQNGYTISSVLCGTEYVTVVGTMPFISEGDPITVTGRYIIHPTYGRQFKAETVDRELPSDSASVLRYLSSGNIKGVGPVTARKIVDVFRERTIDVLRDSPEELCRIKGFSMQRALAIGDEFKKQYGVRDIMLLLGKFKISPEESLNVYKKLGKNAVEIIEKNPFILCSDGLDFPFERVEEIGEYYKIPSNAAERLSAGIEYVLKKNLLNGHTCLPKSKLLAVSSNLLDCGINEAEEVYCNMVYDLRIKTRTYGSTEYAALPEYMSAEEYIAARMIFSSTLVSPWKNTDDGEISLLEKSLKITFDPLQRDAVKKALYNNIFILTGGPGTGKTTTLKAIIELLERRSMEIFLAAPTGRAAKRMSELTGRTASTLHRLLEVEWGENDKAIFTRNERNPLNCDVVIVDEMSMVDTLLFESLLRALPMNCKLILVGDSDQLPSVSAGNVLNDLLLTGAFASVRLDRVFRQASKSAIITNAHSLIKSGEMDISVRGSDFFFVRKSGEETVKAVAELCSERLQRVYGFNGMTDVQVLCPSKKMPLGTINLNGVLQEVLNPLPKDGVQIFYRGINYRVGDKVMQLKNNYELCWKSDSGEEGTGVFNGDMGFIEKIDLRNGLITVRFDDKRAEYTKEDLDQIDLSYAVTVHKSQGSEYDCVIIPLSDTPTRLRYRNLLYTGVTRAKKLLMIIGSEQVLRDMMANDKKTLRYTLLKEIIGENICEKSS